MSIIRTVFAKPNRYTTAKYKTIYVVNKNKDDVNIADIYIQTSKDENKPNWLDINTILLSAFEPILTEPDYINKIFELSNRELKEKIKIVKRMLNLI